MGLMDGDSFKWLVGQGEGLVLAVTIFLVYRKDAKAHETLWQHHAEQQRQQSLALMALIERQVTTNVELLAAIHDQ